MRPIYAFLAMALLGLLVWAVAAGNEVQAQDVIKQSAKSPALIDFESRLTRSGGVDGPFNITVHPSPKGADGFRYMDVPYIQFIGSSTIMFPSGKKDRFGNEWFIYSSNFTLECHPRINPRERTR